MMREDVLKELELWPVWSLRRPQATQPKILENLPEVSLSSEKAQIESAPVEVVISGQTQVAQVHVVQTASLVDTQTYLSYQTENADCLVLHENKEFSEEEEKLWLNICKAMQFLQKMPTRRATIRALLENKSPKVMIIFGEQVAQTMLPQADFPSEKLHIFENIPCVATFSLAHLLLNPLDKGLTWRNLCQALALLS